MASVVAPQSICNSDNDGISSGGDLRGTVSLIEDLAAGAEATINSVYALLCRSADHSSEDGDDLLANKGFCCCPYDPRHRMPPESLFRHWLRCPSAPGGPVPDQGFVETMYYPSTFKSGEELRRENQFVRPLPESGADLCFSLEKELEDVGGSSFFYRDCPGVVTCPEPDVSARTFTLPRVLSAQCANFISGNSMLENGISHRRSVRILPSEFWAFRKELEAWRDYPERYTYVAAQVASCLGEAGDCGFRKWIVSISPRFGIVIDTAMSDHLFLLLKLCLKAVWREALASLDLLAGNNGCLDPRSLYLKCPCLSQTLGWLASQLSILYGEINAKSLAISMIAESLTRAGSRFLLFHLDKWSTSAEIRGLREETHGSKLEVNAGERDAESVSSKDNGCASDLEKLCSGQVFVSQIAAAVAALHERALLEDRVNQLRLPKPLSKHQLLYELPNVSTRAQEERARRPNYRPILDNDGLLWKKTHNQDMTKMKTREELLAEERDYKRRRMSYRGRKVKRTTTQVIRDIIEGHMQEITDAGGIGCHVKGSADSEMPSSRSSHEVEAAAEDVARYESEPSGVSVRDSTVDKKARYLEFDLTAGMAEDARHRDRCITQANRHIVHGNQVNSGRSFSVGERTDYEHERSTKYTSHRRSHDRRSHQREQGAQEVSGRKNERRHSFSSYSFKDHSDSSSLSSSSIINEEFSNMSERRNQTRGRSRDLRRSEPVSETTFEDRYDPFDTCG